MVINRHPPFPDSVAFGNDRKKRGIACHHPKLIVLQREDSIRVVITSANLVEKQVFHWLNFCMLILTYNADDNKKKLLLLWCITNHNVWGKQMPTVIIVKLVLSEKY